MAASSPTPPPSVTYTPARANLLHKQSHLIFPSPSCVSFSMTSSPRIVPEEIACGTAAISTPITAARVCQEHCVSAPFAHARPWRYCTKKAPFSPCFTGTINVPWPSRAPLLSFSLAVILSLFPRLLRPLSEVSCLYWMVQKQNHKPISVTLAMRLDGPNLSPSRAIGSTPVSLKRTLSSRRRGSFVFGDNCN